MGRAYFTAELFDFLTDLTENNNREWFQANRERYRAVVQEPLLRFIADFARPLHDISPHFVADPRPSGGSMFRIYRDVRFSKDKSPYKTHAAAQFRHRAGRDAHTPCFYLHLAPTEVFAGAGLWHPPGPAMAAIRDAIVERTEAWAAAITDPAFGAAHTLGGDSLKRAPRGYDPEHPQVEHLKRKDFVCYRDLTRKHACSAGFLDLYADTCRSAVPFVRFITEAVGHDFDA